MDLAYCERNAASFARLRELVERLIPTDLERALGDGWTVKAALMHMAFWDRYAAIFVDRWQRWGFQRTKDDDAEPINRAGLPEWLVAPPDHEFSAAIAAAEHANEVAASASDELRIAIDAGGEAWACQRFLHWDEHIAPINVAFPDQP